MANKIKIGLSSNPGNLDGISFRVFRIDDDFSKTYFVRFVPTPVSFNHVGRGSVLSDTIGNLYHYLAENETGDFVSYSLDDDFITMEFAEVGSYGFEKLIILREADYDLTLVSFTEEHLPSVADFPFRSFAIEIIDTHDNDRVLIDEATQMGSPTIKWDGGDDLYSTFMTSQLTFNMMVTDGSDAKFKHLFTGDEQRYLVRLLFVNEEDEVSLCWRGYLLPDQFKEPYKNEVNFIEFTAVDMIGSLKGKVLPPWFYHNRFPIAKLMAFILQMTGLKQDMLVKPSIVPDRGRTLDTSHWKNININLAPYYDGKKYTDVYKILEDILKAQALTLYSYKGFWWLEGFTRKKDVSGSVNRFDENGDPVSGIMPFSKKVTTSLFERNVPVFTGITPWKVVNVDFAAKGNKNMFRDEVLEVTDIYTAHYVLGQFWLQSGSPDYWQYMNKNFLLWKQVTNDSFSDYDTSFGRWKFSFGHVNPQPPNYDYSEAMAMVNYFECPDYPFVKNGVKYELEMEFVKTVITIFSSPEALQERINAGELDMMVPFRLFIGDREVVSNRPSFSQNGNLRYKVSSTRHQSGQYMITYSLKHEFEAEIDGFVRFQILVPIRNLNNIGINSIGQLSGKILKLGIVSDYDARESVIATRAVNYTQVLDYSTNLSSSIDVSVENNMGIGSPTNGVYFNEISRDINPYDFDDFHYFGPGIYAYMTLGTWQISKALFDFLFIHNKIATVFLEKANGDRIPFNSLYGQRNEAGEPYRMGYLKSVTGKPILPKGYKVYSHMETGDVVKYMNVKYPDEDYSKRLNWKIIGDYLALFDKSYGYNEALALALHAIQPEAMYRLEGRALELIFPDQLVNFYFDSQDRKFIPTTLELNLSEGKTALVATERKFKIPNDVSYE